MGDVRSLVDAKEMGFQVILPHSRCTSGTERAHQRAVGAWRLGSFARSVRDLHIDFVYAPSTLFVNFGASFPALSFGEINGADAGVQAEAAGFTISVDSLVE